MIRKNNEVVGGESLKFSLSYVYQTILTPWFLGEPSHKCTTQIFKLNFFPISYYTQSNSIGEYLAQEVLKNRIKINDKAWINEVTLSKLGFLGSVRNPNVAPSRWTALSLSFLARKPKRRVCFSTSPSSTSPSSLWASSATSPPASLNRLVWCLSRRPYLEHGRLSLNLDVSVSISQSSLSRWLSSSTSPSSLSVEPRRLSLEPRRLCLNLSIFALSVTFILDFSVFSLSLESRRLSLEPLLESRLHLLIGKKAFIFLIFMLLLSRFCFCGLVYLPFSVRDSSVLSSSSTGYEVQKTEASKEGTTEGRSQTGLKMKKKQDKSEHPCLLNLMSLVIVW